MTQDGTRGGSPAPKPRMRGWLHGAAAVVAIPSGIAIVVSAPAGKPRAAAAVYAVGLAGMFGASASYHLLSWSPRWLARMKRLDHSMIYALIAGTYTPFALLVVSGAWGISLLSISWAGAALGVTFTLARPHGFPRFTGALYVVLGWMALLAFPWFLRSLTLVELGLVIAGGVVYTLGAIVLLRNKPDPSPTIFGYHEVWHVAVVVACACFYAAIWLTIRGLP